MIIVPGNTGSTVPIKPTANRITATDHQKSSISLFRVYRFSDLTIHISILQRSNEGFDPVIAIPIVELPPLNSNRRIYLCHFLLELKRPISRYRPRQLTDQSK